MVVTDVVGSGVVTSRLSVTCMCCHNDNLHHGLCAYNTLRLILLSVFWCQKKVFILCVRFDKVIRVKRVITGRLSCFLGIPNYKRYRAYYKYEKGSLRKNKWK